MTDLEQQLTDHLQRRAAAAVPRYDLEAIERDMPRVSFRDDEDPRGRRQRTPTVRILAIAACLVLAVVIAAALLADRQSVDTVPPSDTPPNHAVGGPSTLVRGVVDFVGTPSGVCGQVSGEIDMQPTDCLAGQTLDITALIAGSEASGEARFGDIAVELQCSDPTAPDGVVVLGGEVTQTSTDGTPSVGELIALIVRDGAPDSAAVWPDEHDSCGELFRSIPGVWFDFLNSALADVVDGDEIEFSECPTPTQPRAITSGGQMKPRFAKPVATAAAAILLLGACSDDDPSAAADDGPTTLAKGEDVNFVGGPPGLSDQTMDIDAVEDDGKVTGEAVFDPYGTVDLQCADTDSDDVLIIGGQLTETEDADAAAGDWVAVIIRVDDPKGVEVWFADAGTESCDEVVEQAAASDHVFADLADGDDIETG